MSAFNWNVLFFYISEDVNFLEGAFLCKLCVHHTSSFFHVHSFRFLISPLLQQWIFRRNRDSYFFYYICMIFFLGIPCNTSVLWWCIALAHLHFFASSYCCYLYNKIGFGVSRIEIKKIFQKSEYLLYCKVLDFFW